MKKVLICFLSVLVATDAFAAKFKMGDSGACFVQDRSWVKDTFWYCGQQKLGCAGVKHNNRDEEYWLYHGDSFSQEGNTYFCCNGSASGMGRYAKGSSWIVSTKTVRIDLEGGGKCSYVKRMNVCGTEESKPCTDPDICEAGLILFNGKCVTAPIGNDAFGSEDSVEIVDCSPTNYKGIYYYQEEGSVEVPVCKQCNEKTEFFDHKNKKCISKSSMKQYTKDVMHKCFMCETAYFKACMDMMSLPSKERVGFGTKVGSTDVTGANIAKNCNIIIDTDDTNDTGDTK